MTNLRLALAALTLFPAAPLLAQAAPPPPAAPAPKPATVFVRITTSEGPILLELEKEKAPVTVANFLKYVDLKRYDGISFYRAVAVPNEPSQGFIQGGIREDARKILPPIAHESTTKTGLHHTNGAISMARNAPGTATCDFFIIVGDMTYMDANPSAPGDNQGYAVFGHVVEGMDVVKKILAAPRSPTAGVGVMKGQMLAAPVKIVTARRATAPVAKAP
ncbi:peptidylprolyl isomerase [Rhizorhabdus dicambivorans]|uniref:peptidylprolyl isomerase n=1 Tax=Rhizorhabdus dicambivorans TaxID=1850238 RepID=A0A2A4G0G8_9SPHN|nr:peptidylprolyl isomerase [Rhizorhabdus dicambivorans]ATE63026.1 peptidylprolyl isomerase [Rhizorhabdus dicambivorans]PCE43202.1 peptidylprolyl isomerase [Rhizorhabdus dicambivorans]